MKVWWIIANEEYYPSEGLEDFYASFETEEEARSLVTILEHSSDLHYHVINIAGYLL